MLAERSLENFKTDASLATCLLHKLRLDRQTSRLETVYLRDVTIKGHHLDLPIDWPQ